MKIIKNKEVFSINYIPKKLPARQELVEEICSKLKLSDRYNLLLMGLTGNGKTISVKKAVEKLGNKVASAYVDCSEANTYTSVAKQIIEDIRNKRYKEKGKNRYELADDLKKLMLTKRKKQLVFIFDEIDKLVGKKDRHWDVLFPLLNYGDASFIFISNDSKVLEKIDRKIFSRFQFEKKFLDIYESEEIYQILKQRAELGLFLNSFEDNLLIHIAKLSCEISGDVRFALKLLEKSAIVSELSNQEKISEEGMKEAIKELQVSEIENVFSNLPKHMGFVVIALCIEARLNKDCAITTDAYKTYAFNVKKERFGAVGERQFREYLTSLEMLGLFELRWMPAPHRRGRVRVAIPLFDYLPWLEMNFLNNGDERVW